MRQEATNFARFATKIIHKVNSSLPRKNAGISFAKTLTKISLSIKLNSPDKATFSNALNKVAAKLLQKTWYRVLSMRKHTKNLSNLDKIMRLQCQMIKSFAPILHVNKLFKRLRTQRKLNAKLANEICALIVQLNGTKDNPVIRRRKSFMRDGPMSLELIDVLNARFQSKRILDACT